MKVPNIIETVVGIGNLIDLPWPEDTKFIFNLFGGLGVIIALWIALNNTKQNKSNLNVFYILFLLWGSLLYIHNKHVSVSYLDGNQDNVVIYPLFMTEYLQEIYELDFNNSPRISNADIRDAIDRQQDFCYGTWTTYCLLLLLNFFANLFLWGIIFNIIILIRSTYNELE